ncbi:unnamed protein product [Boreogadus saida]
MGSPYLVLLRRTRARRTRTPNTSSNSKPVPFSQASNSSHTEQTPPFSASPVFTLLSLPHPASPLSTSPRRPVLSSTLFSSTSHSSGLHSSSSLLYSTYALLSSDPPTPPLTLPTELQLRSGGSQWDLCVCGVGEY